MDGWSLKSFQWNQEVISKTASFKSTYTWQSILTQKWHFKRWCGWYFTPKARRRMGSYWISLKKTPQISKEFWCHRARINWILVNIHSFMQLLHNRYFEVLVDHKVIEYMIKSKTESPTARLKTLLLKLSEYTIELKYQKGSKMHTSDALSQLHNFTDTPDEKDIIPLNFLQHFTPN